MPGKGLRCIRRHKPAGNLPDGIAATPLKRFYFCKQAYGSFGYRRITPYIARIIYYPDRR